MVFEQVLKDDGRIGPTPVTATTIEHAGATSLTQMSNNYYLYANGTTSGPTLKLNNAAVTLHIYPRCAGSGDECSSGGYEVAWKNASTGQYVLWSTDNNGNFIQNF